MKAAKKSAVASATALTQESLSRSVMPVAGAVAVEREVAPDGR